VSDNRVFQIEGLGRALSRPSPYRKMLQKRTFLETPITVVFGEELKPGYTLKWTKSRIEFNREIRAG
jgi:hypothetical protein